MRRSTFRSTKHRFRARISRRGRSSGTRPRFFAIDCAHMRRDEACATRHGKRNVSRGVTFCFGIMRIAHRDAAVVCKKSADFVQVFRVSARVRDMRIGVRIRTYVRACDAHVRCARDRSVSRAWSICDARKQRRSPSMRGQPKQSHAGGKKETARHGRAVPVRRVCVDQFTRTALHAAATAL